MISPRQLEEREARKERIMAGALEVFRAKGLEKATMEEIAAAAGFGKATLYYYFSSKEEVFSQIMEKGWKALWNGIEQTIHQSNNSRERFFQTLKRIVEITLTDRNLYAFLFSAQQAVPNLSADLQTWRGYQQRLYGALQGLIEEGIARGEFPPVKSEILLRAIGGVFHGLMFLGGGETKVREKDIEELVIRMLDTPVT
jgi:AcrR family transcriptional regulator